MIDVDRLRAEAAQRARERAGVAFDGSVENERVAGRSVRRYLPVPVGAAPPWVVFLHGGYGLFGDLELQDAYCRVLAATLPGRVAAVDYRLAPEHPIGDSVADVVGVLDLLRSEGAGPVLLCGDSAGGALAVATALESSADVAGLLLTNPNVDLSLACLDPDRPAGPDPEISEYAFRAWTGGKLADAPRFQDQAALLPPVFVAVGDQDSLAPECEALAAARTRAGKPAELLTLPDVGHGFMGDLARARGVVRAMAAFVDSAIGPLGEQPSRARQGAPDAG